jgi:hypothetical protein
MSHGPVQVFTGSIASGASTVTSIYLSNKSYSRVYADIGTMSTAAALDVFQSVDDSTFVPVFERVNTAPVQYQTLTVASSVATSSGRIPLDVVGPYLQFRASAVISGGCVIKVVCVD